MKDEFIIKWKSQVKKGTLSFILLKLMQQREMYGYELMEQISNKAAFTIAEGTLYPLLNRLKEAELVSSKWVEQTSGIPRKYYSLTENGEKTLAEMEEFWKNLNNTITKI